MFEPDPDCEAPDIFLDNGGRLVEGFQIVTAGFIDCSQRPSTVGFLIGFFIFDVTLVLQLPFSLHSPAFLYLCQSSIVVVVGFENASLGVDNMAVLFVGNITMHSGYHFLALAHSFRDFEQAAVFVADFLL